jgi:hypothetical protein
MWRRRTRFTERLTAAIGDASAETSVSEGGGGDVDTMRPARRRAGRLGCRLWCRLLRRLFCVLSCRDHHPAFATEVALLQVGIALKSLALSSEINYAVMVDDHSTTLTNARQIAGGSHFDSHALQFVLPDALRVGCSILDALVSGLLLLLLLSAAAHRAGNGTALAIAALALFATASDLAFLAALGTTLNAGVLAHTAQ